MELAGLKDLLGSMALVAPKDLQFGIGNMVRAYCESEGVRFETFRRMEDALAWVHNEIGTQPPRENNSHA